MWNVHEFAVDRYTIIIVEQSVVMLYYTEVEKNK